VNKCRLGGRDGKSSKSYQIEGSEEAETEAETSSETVIAEVLAGVG
jgi:hypothetical protein